MKMKIRIKNQLEKSNEYSFILRHIFQIQMKFKFLVSKGNINSSKGKGDTDNLNCVFFVLEGGALQNKTKTQL